MKSSAAAPGGSRARPPSLMWQRGRGIVGRRRPWQWQFRQRQPRSSRGRAAPSASAIARPARPTREVAICACRLTAQASSSPAGPRLIFSALWLDVRRLLFVQLVSHSHGDHTPFHLHPHPRSTQRWRWAVSSSSTVRHRADADELHGKPSGGWNGAGEALRRHHRHAVARRHLCRVGGHRRPVEADGHLRWHHDFLSYEFWAFNKKKERDPLAWTVAVQNVCGEFTQVSSEDEGTLDPGRGQSYTPGGSFALVVGSAAAAGSCDPLPPSLPPPSLPPAPPSLPPAPPSLPHGDAYSFVFTGVRGPNADGIALSEIGLFDAEGATIAVVDATNRRRQLRQRSIQARRRQHRRQVVRL